METKNINENKFEIIMRDIVTNDWYLMFLVIAGLINISLFNWFSSIVGTIVIMVASKAIYDKNEAPLSDNNGLKKDRHQS